MVAINLLGDINRIVDSTLAVDDTVASVDSSAIYSSTIVLAVLVALVVVVLVDMVGSRHLQLGRARSIVAKLSARTKIGNFENDFFMGLNV